MQVRTASNRSGWLSNALIRTSDSMVWAWSPMWHKRSCCRTCSYAASYLSERKGYGIRLGLGLGMLTVVIGVVIMLFLPAREGSDWRVLGPVGRGKQGV